MARLRHFSDLSMTFDEHPATGDLVRLHDDAAIIQSVKNLIFTNYYERPFQPWVGSGITGTFFENVSSLTKYTLQKSVYLLIKQYEPRVKVELKDIIVNDDIDNNALSVTIYMKVVNIEKDISAEISLKRLR